MERFFKEEEAKFGVTSNEAFIRTRCMMQVETEKISALTLRLKDYLNDLESAFSVLET